MSITTDHQQIIDIAEVAFVRVGDQALPSQGHCVNVLLDLYCATEDFAIRWAIADRLNEIRFVNAVEGDDIRADLTAIIAIASADVFTELEWSRKCAGKLPARRHRLAPRGDTPGRRVRT